MSLVFMAGELLEKRLEEYTKAYFDTRLEQFEALCMHPERITSDNRFDLRYFLNISKELLESIPTDKNFELTNPRLGKAISEAMPTLRRALRMNSSELETYLVSKTPVGSPVFASQYLNEVAGYRTRKLTPDSKNPSPRQEREDSKASSEQNEQFRLDM